jgi:hypothetical protein
LPGSADDLGVRMPCRLAEDCYHDWAALYQRCRGLFTLGKGVAPELPNQVVDLDSIRVGEGAKAEESNQSRAIGAHAIFPHQFLVFTCRWVRRSDMHEKTSARYEQD